MVPTKTETMRKGVFAYGNRSAVTDSAAIVRRE
jgi:hypothetical protein